MFSPKWKYHPFLKVAMREQYGKLILSYEVLFNKTKVISY